MAQINADYFPHENPYSLYFLLSTFYFLGAALLRRSPRSEFNPTPSEICD